jgi:hypothetical protein
LDGPNITETPTSVEDERHSLVRRRRRWFSVCYGWLIDFLKFDRLTKQPLRVSLNWQFASPCQFI